MTDDTLLEYRIVKDHNKFVAIDSTDEILGIYKTEQEALKVVESREAGGCLVQALQNLVSRRNRICNERVWRRPRDIGWRLRQNKLK